MHTKFDKKNSRNISITIIYAIGLYTIFIMTLFRVIISNIGAGYRYIYRCSGGQPRAIGPGGWQSVCRSAACPPGQCLLHIYTRGGGGRSPLTATPQLFGRVALFPAPCLHLCRVTRAPEAGVGAALAQWWPIVADAGPPLCKRCATTSAGQTFPPGSVTGGRPPPPLHGHWHRPGLGAVTCLFGVLCCGHSPAQPVNHL